MVGRKRIKNKLLPPRVYRHHGSYRFVHESGKKTTLSRVSDGHGAMLRALADIMGDLPSLSTLAAVFDRYELEIIPKKAESTQKDNCRQLKRLRDAFGQANPHDLRAFHAAQYRDKRAQKAPTSANRELELLSHVCTMAVEWGAMDRNPLFRLRKIERPPRDRYVTDHEYRTVYDLASPMVQCVMELALLTGLRRNDVFRLVRKGMTEEGIVIKPGKTQKTSRVYLLFEWTPDLEAVVKRALKLKPQFRQWIVCNRKGEHFTKNGFDSVWNRLMKKAVDSGMERFEFRDLRAKNASDEPELSVAQARLGHTSPDITDRVYRRTAKKVRPLR